MKLKKNVDFFKCNKCDGTGTVDIGTYDFGGGLHESHIVNCEYCNGLGVHLSNDAVEKLKEKVL